MIGGAQAPGKTLRRALTTPPNHHYHIPSRMVSPRKARSHRSQSQLYGVK
ncbi:hypothetical protein DY000_02026627 [Brassica cretica]|uniref:Uncharacterized protein n=1 Tax=Brassica cretica TaxID=69181 RepID=A0ABQ7EH18_BRACR|nr:hypothetical protein DY000_02026627 [Brassica cretica]